MLRRTFFRQVTGAAVGWYSLPPWLSAEPLAASLHLPRSTPAAEGVAASGILAFLEAVAKAKIELHSFMMVRHGNVIAEGWWAPYGPDLRHTLYSMSKSFTSTSVGLAVAAGKLKVEDQVVSFFPKELPDKVSDNLASLKVKHLLTMSVGHEREPLGAIVTQENWVKAFLATPIVHAPGSMFLYNSLATYMLSAIVQQVTGQKIVDYLRPRLFEPLGIENAAWETCPRGINTGGWGLSGHTESLAKFGQLYLQKGQWKGREILPAAWVDEATTFKIQQPNPPKANRPKDRNDWLQGYCYQFWRCQHQAFRGDGAFGQFTIVMPEQQAVVAMTAETGNMQGVLDHLWEHVLPAMQDKALPPDQSQQQETLRDTLGKLALKPVEGLPTSETVASVSEKVFKIGPNSLGIETVSLAFKDGACVATFGAVGVKHTVTSGFNEWKLGETALPGTPPRLVSGGASPKGTPFKVAVSGAWKDKNTFEMMWRYYETPHHDTVTCRFDEKDVTINFVSSIAVLGARGKDARPPLKGTTI